MPAQSWEYIYVRLDGIIHFNSNCYLRIISLFEHLLRHVTSRCILCCRLGVQNKVSSLKSEPGPSYWEGKAPPSSVLGVGEKVSSKVFGPLSLVAFVVGLYCVHENNIFNRLSATSVNPRPSSGPCLFLFHGACT